MTKGDGKKVFISSTCFDLKDLRAELAKALKEWGHMPIWNESPDFPKKHGLHSHDTCIDAVKECDIYLLIIDKRYGGTYAGNKYPKEDISITWYETNVALQENKEIHTFVRDEVWNERPTYKKNLGEGIQIKPHHVDNPKVFEFIDFIVHLPRDNWIDTFKDSVDLKEKLKLRLKESLWEKTLLPPHLTNITPPEPNFVGRQGMLSSITKWYKNADVHIGALIGWGGVGKSALVRKWYDSLEENDIHPDGIFWWGFYRNPYLERFLDSLLEYLATSRINLQEIKSSWAKVYKIKELILEGEYLIILDGLEEIQKGKDSGEEFGCMIHRELSEILRFLADAETKGLLLITSRYPLKDIKNWEGLSYQKRDIERLSIDEAWALFENVGVKGGQEDIDRVINEYKGHALSLTLLANYLVEDFKGDIKRAKDIPPFYSNKEAGGKAHRMLLWYAKQLKEEQLTFMKIFSLFRRAVNENDFEGVFRSEMETSINKQLRDKSLFSFKRMVDNLCDRRLITKGQDDTYITHPLIKNYFESILGEEDKKLCHKHIYHFIGTYAPELPETLEAMQPLFEQVYHGCAAGMYDDTLYDVYQKKIQQGKNFFLIFQLGAWDTDLLLHQNFFPQGNFWADPRVSDPIDKAYIFHQAGISMLSIGKLENAEYLFKKALDFRILNKAWETASVSCHALAHVKILRGSLNEAAAISIDAERLAKKADDIWWEGTAIVYFAWISFLRGEMVAADLKFKQVYELRKREDPSAKYLLQLPGVIYADFLIASGRTEKALEVTEENLIRCKGWNLVNFINYCYRSLTSIFRHLKKLKEAEDNALTAIEGARKTGMANIEAEALIELGRIKLEQRLHQEAEKELNTALQICKRCSFKLYEPDAEVVLAKVFLAQGDKDKAKQFAQSAYDKADKMHYHWPKVEAEELLKEISH